MSSKVRKALEKCVRRLDAITPYLPLEFRKYVFADIQEAKAALAEPLKNCEVGTAEEQYGRFRECCKKQRIPCLLSYDYRCDECYSKWSQMPYESEDK